MNTSAEQTTTPHARAAQWGIGTKITLLLSAIAVLASITVGVTIYGQFSRALVDQELVGLSNLCEVKATRFAAELESLRADALFVSRSPVMQRLVRAQLAGGVDPRSGEAESPLRERASEFCYELLRAKPAYCQVRLIGVADGGREMIRANRNFQDLSPRVVPRKELQQKGKEPYFSAALKLTEGDVYLSDINWNREHGKVADPPAAVIRAATPIFGRDGKPAAILVINRSFQPLVEALLNGLPHDHTLLVANDRGDYLVHPDAAKVFGFDRGKPARLQDDYASLSKLLGAPTHATVSIVDHAPGHVRMAFGVCRVPVDPRDSGRFVEIAVAAPYDAAIAVSARTRQHSLMAGAVVALIALGSGYFLSRSVTGPLRKIAAAAEAFGRGGTIGELPTSNRDEIGVVARSLVSMMADIQAAHSDLERRAGQLGESRRSALNMLQDVEANRANAIAAKQSALEQSARTQAILDGATDSIITIRPDGAIESFNAAAERMFGYSASEVLGKNVNILMPAPYHEEHDQYLRNYLESGISKIIGIGREVVGLRADGRTFPVDLAVSEVRLGKERRFTGIVRDVSKLKQTMTQLSEAHAALQQRAQELEAARRASVRAEQQAHDQAARTQAILDGATDAIITISPDGIVESFNGAAERIFGHQAEVVIGQNVKMLMPSPYHEEHDQYLVNYLTTGVSKIIGIGREVLGLRADGSTFPMHLAVSDVKLGDRRLFTGIVRDISDLKRTMQQLTAANDELARGARQIERFNNDLQRSNEELKQFAYVASHDLQEPLRKVTAFCQLLKDDYGDRLDENAKTYIQYAVDGALRMKTLVQDLLTYSRVETQGKPLEPVSADDACREAIENLTMAIDEAAAEITRDELPTVLADRAQLVRLFQNLIGNAIKYRGPQLPIIHVSSRTQGELVEFRVRDNGIGIDSQYHQRIFVIFQRLHGHDEYSGTGIGLAVCKRIVERAGGRIWVESSPGAGSEFCFTLQKMVVDSKSGGRTHDLHSSRVVSQAD